MPPHRDSNKRECPLCANEMDEADVETYYCKCKGQICGFCYDRLIKSDDPRCPFCRELYDKNNVRRVPKFVYSLSKNRLVFTLIFRKKRHQAQKQQRSHNSLTEQQLNVTVLVPNAAFVSGLPDYLANETVCKDSFIKSLPFLRFPQILLYTGCRFSSHPLSLVGLALSSDCLFPYINLNIFLMCTFGIRMRIWLRAVSMS